MKMNAEQQNEIGRMRKAFLCHSSADKAYVDIVANKLGRAKVLYDRLHFAPGQDFRSEILRHLDRASLFVFFASPKSLASTWCQFELQEAELRVLSGGIEAQLTLIIDQGVTHGDLPKWMQFTKAVLQPRPSQATRDIEGALYSLMPESFRAPFIGRSAQMREFVQVFSSRQPAPKLLLATGLEGVGRRTYLERATKDNLSLSLGPVFLFDETKRLEDLYLWLFNETDDLTSRVEIKEELAAFSSLTLSEQVAEIVARLKILCHDNSIPCIVDYGGILTDEGKYSEPLSKLVGEFANLVDDYHLAFVHQRVPITRDEPFVPRIFHQTIPPLDANEARLLLQRLLKKNGMTASGDQLKELLEYLGGYPPAIYLVAMHAKTNGLEILMADKSVLTDFQAKRFAGLIAKLDLRSEEWFVLRYLSSELVVPLSVIALAANLDVQEAAAIVRNLIEQSLVMVVNDQYGLSSPIRYAIERVKGNLDSAAYASICERLTKEFWETEDAAPSIEVVDATLHAAARAGSVDLQPYSDLIRVSIVHRLALECYYRREWTQALAYVERAIAMDPWSKELLELHFKSLVRLERFGEARERLDQIKETGSRNYYYLKGFFHRKQRQHKEAVEAFQAAEALGNRSQALLRDYADSLHRLRRDEEALAKIELARRREPADIYILDLYIKIRLAMGDIGEADNALQELARYDVDQKFLHHRRATVLAKKKQWNAALTEAEIAYDSGRGTFEAHCQKIDILIELGRFDQIDAELERLNGRFGAFRRDVQLGLRCKSFVRQGDWRRAQVVWDSLADKTSELNTAVVRQILTLKAADQSISLVDRQAARDEVALLDPDLREADF